MKNLIDAETTDLVELLRNGPVGHNHTPEQEVNFDAGYTPSPYEPKFLREEWIDGKKYRVFAG
ncbi:uncharacterized protein METZ01_LOCUS53635 [marine metagenome]|jgi:hypothetical protein|uniref:Methylmalonyl-CoA mutase domain-containing protein n=1 Tax=marine metagenome TaxID=408172 RepID=A0A381SBU9_9ZZZZ|tara:strand:+ start:860 stop:1048 length:189 start_codon:yes stop_codon:yes gene_type:complete